MPRCPITEPAWGPCDGSVDIRRVAKRARKKRTASSQPLSLRTRTGAHAPAARVQRYAAWDLCAAFRPRRRPTSKSQCPGMHW